MTFWTSNSKIKSNRPINKREMKKKLSKKKILELWLLAEAKQKFQWKNKRNQPKQRLNQLKPKKNQQRPPKPIMKNWLNQKPPHPPLPKWRKHQLIQNQKPNPRLQLNKFQKTA